MPPMEASKNATPPTSGHPRWVTALLVLGTIVTLLAVFSIWANRQALNTDEWVHTSDRLLANEPVEERVASFIAEQVFTNVDVQAKLEEALPPKLAPLAGAAAGGPRGVAPQGARRGPGAARTPGTLE